MLLPGTPRPAVASAQLAGLASSCVLPGGSASGSVIQASVLVRAGNPAGQVAAALGSVGLLTTGMLLALPILTVPAVLIQPPPARQLQLGLVVSLIVAVVLVLLGLALLHWDSFVSFVGRVAGRVLHLVRRGISAAEVADRVVAQRDKVAAAFAGRWGRALAAAAATGCSTTPPSSLPCTPSVAAPAPPWCSSPTSCPWRSRWCPSRPVVSASSRPG